MVAKAGHEIGLHGYSHENPLALTPHAGGGVFDRSIGLNEQRLGAAAARLRRALVGGEPITIEILIEVRDRL